MQHLFCLCGRRTSSFPLESTNTKIHLNDSVCQFNGDKCFVQYEGTHQRYARIRLPFEFLESQFIVGQFVIALKRFVQFFFCFSLAWLIQFTLYIAIESIFCLNKTPRYRWLWTLNALKKKPHRLNQLTNNN